MKKLITAFLILICSLYAMADGDNSSGSQDGKAYVLYPKKNPTPTHRTPAMPIYGYYSGDVLRFDIHSDDLEEIYILKVYESDGVISYEGYYSVCNLIEGVVITLSDDSSIELVTSSGKTYSQCE